jgi:hypothetical protein
MTSLLAQEIVFNQKCAEYKGVEYALLRTLEPSQKVLLVNTESLDTVIYLTKELSGFKQCKQQDLKRTVLNEPKSIINRGLKNGFKDAYTLTIDMCPSSKKGFELDLFRTLMTSQKTSPVTISMTKKWAIHHPDEFKKLKAWDDQNKLDITWMNHGSSHPYRPNVPIENNFINLEGVDFEKEVLDNEKFLIQEGRVPSVFYRFAGLVSNEKDFKYLIKELGLIPIGSRAWLAKGEKVQKGSIVLVHGNRNEPLGVKLWLKSQSRLPVIGITDMFARSVLREPILFIFLKTPQ